MPNRPFSLVTLVREPLSPVEGPAPTLVLVHGFGSNEEDLFALAPLLDRRLRVVAARAPVTLGPGSYAWFPLNFQQNGLLHDSDEALAALDTLRGYLAEVTAAYSLPASSLYLAGFSQGAAMAAAHALMHPEGLGGALALSGLLMPEVPSRQAPDDRLHGFPLFVAHGTQDAVVPISQGRALRDHLQGTPVDLTYREYPIGHEVSAESLADSVAWLARRIDGKA